MRRILRLEVSTRNNPNPEPGCSLYYVRSFTLAIRQLLDIIGKWDQQLMLFEECLAWKKAVKFEKDQDTLVSIRYIGMSSRCLLGHGYRRT